MYARLFVVALLLAIPLASAVPPASPTSLPSVDRYVFGELALDQPNLTSIVLSGDLYLYRYTVNGKVYNADDLGEAVKQTNKYAGEASGDAFVGKIEQTAQAGISSILAASFPGADLSGVTANVDRSTLVAASGNAFDPPVRVALTGNVQRTRAAIGLGTISDAAVEAAFASGAAVAADFALKVDSGYHIVFMIAPPATPAGLRFATGGGVSADGSSLRADVDNSTGQGVALSFSARLIDASVTPSAAEDIRSTIDVTMGDINKGDTGIPINVMVNADVRALDVVKHFPTALPPKVSLPFINAEGIRALRATGVIKDADLAKANEGLLASIQKDVSRAFGPGATVTGGLDTADLAKPATKPYTEDPPVKFVANAETTYKVLGATGDDVDLALRIGGRAEVDLALFAVNGRETTYIVHPLRVAEFTHADGGNVSADKLTATFVVPAVAKAYPAGVSLRGRGVPTYTAEESTVDVTVDLKDLDVSLGQITSGDFGNLVMGITVTGQLGVIKVPEELKSALPSTLELEYVNADAIRLLIAHGKISEANLTKLENSLLDKMRANLGRALDGDIPVAGGLDRVTLSASLVAVPISADLPITFQATANVVKPLAGGPVQPQAAIALYTTQLPLTLPKLDGLDTQYTVILPRGLAVTDVAATGATSETGKAADGRDQFTVTPEGTNSQVMVSMAVTPTFVLLKFWPLVLLAVILLVLIVGTPIALITRARGKKNKAAKK